MPYSDLKNNLQVADQIQKSMQDKINAVNEIRDKGELLVGNGTTQSSLDPSTGSDKDVLVQDSLENVGIKWSLPNHMTPTGVIPGSYSATNIVVDSQGLILSASTGSVDINDITPSTTKGDLLVQANSELVRLPVGSQGQILTVDTAEPTCMTWGGLDINDITPSTTKGDLLVDNGTSLVSLPVGLNNTILLADSAEPTGLKYGTLDDIIPFTTSGDLLIQDIYGNSIAFNSSNVTNDLLTIDTSVSETLTKWAALDINNITPNFAKGDLLIHDSSNNIVRLPIGNDGDALTVDSLASSTSISWKPAPSGGPAPSNQFTMVGQGLFNNQDINAAPIYWSDQKISGVPSTWATYAAGAANIWHLNFPFVVKGIMMLFYGYLNTGVATNLNIAMTEMDGSTIIPGVGTPLFIPVSGNVTNGKATYMLTDPHPANTSFLIQATADLAQEPYGRPVMFVIH